jgi:hypothetical protein
MVLFEINNNNNCILQCAQNADVRIAREMSLHTIGGVGSDGCGGLESSSVRLPGVPEIIDDLQSYQAVRPPYAPNELSQETMQRIVDYERTRRASFERLAHDPYYKFAQIVAGRTTLRTVDNAYSARSSEAMKYINAAPVTGIGALQTPVAPLTGTAPFSPGGAPASLPVDMQLMTTFIANHGGGELLAEYIRKSLVAANNYYEAMAVYNETNIYRRPQYTGYLDFSDDLYSAIEIAIVKVNGRLPNERQMTADALIRDDATRALFAEVTAMEINGVRGGLAPRSYQTNQTYRNIGAASTLALNRLVRVILGGGGSCARYAPYRREVIV